MVGPLRRCPPTTSGLTSVFHLVCVMDEGPAWEARVHTLLASLRQHGGRVSAAPFTVVAVGEVSRRFVALVHDLSGSVRAATPVVPDRPFMNKVRGLELDFDVDTILLDCDTVVVADIADLEPGRGSVRAKVDDADPFLPDDWAAFTAATGPLGYGSHRTTVTQQTTGLFLNSGVLAVAREVRGDLARVWLRMFADADRVAQDRRPDKAFFAEQVALGAALVALGIDVDELPVEYNWPAHIAPVPPHLPTPEPRLIHYHAMCRRCRVMAPLASPRVQRILDRLADGAIGVLEQPGREAARDVHEVARATERLRARSAGRSDGTRATI